MTEETSATDLANGDDQGISSPSSTLQSLRKGGSLFGKSASSANEPVEIQEKPISIDEATSSGDPANTTELTPNVSDENVEVPAEVTAKEPTDDAETARNGDEINEGEGANGLLTAHDVSGDAEPATEAHEATYSTTETNVSIQEQSDVDTKVNESTEEFADEDKSCHTAAEPEEVEEKNEEEAVQHVEEEVKEEEETAEAEEKEDVAGDVAEPVEKEEVTEKEEKEEDVAETVEEAAGGDAEEAMETEEPVVEDDSGKKEDISEDAPEAMEVEEPCELKILAPETVDEEKKDQEDVKEEDEAVGDAQEETEAAEEAEQEAEEVKAIPKRAAATPRGKARSAKKAAETPKEIPKRTPRRAAAAKDEEEEKEATPEVQKTPKSQRRTRSLAEDVEEPAESDSEKAEEVEEPVKTPRNARSARRGAAEAKTPAAKTPVGKEADDDEEEEEEQEEEVPQTRSLRTRSAKIEKTSSAKASTQRATRGSAVKSEAETPRSRVQKVDEESKESTSRSSRRSAASKATPAQTEAVEKTPKSSRAKKVSTKSDDLHETPKRGAAKESDTEDPYDVTTQLDQHPEPLKNIHMKVQSFGDMKFQRVGSGKYTATEKAAEERVGNLSDLVPKAKERRSLAELTPGRGRTAATPRNFKSAPASRRNRSKKSESEDMEVDEDVAPARGSSRKRKASPVAGTPPKKAAISAPELTEDQQWEVDHPGDEGAHLEVGARVYAVFDKVFYPAVVISERDAHGRYKVQFVEDKVVRDVPIAGLVPLRAVVAGKECFYDENGASVVASPNAASAPEWVKGIFKIEVEDQDDIVEVEWSKLSLDMNDWKEYIHQKSLEASAVATDNISSSKSRRSRVEVVAAEAATPVTKTPSSRASAKKKTPKKDTASVSTPKSTKAKAPKKVEKEDEEEETQEAQKEVDTNDGGSEASEDPSPTALFKGMMFILTSAQRDGSSNFKKKLMSDFIQQCEGLVFEDFKDVDQHPDMDAFLISDTHYRTHKYLSAMARGVPCVSHEWILKCRESGTLVKNDEFLLPAGVSILDQKVYPLPRNQAKLLKDKVVLVHSNNRPSSAKALNFIQIWEPMIGLLGGQPITDTEQLSDDIKIDIMLTDASATPDLLERSRADDAMIVSSEWLIQGIIMDQLADPSSHNRFQYDGGVAGGR